MSESRHERPGVYSAYDASAVVSAGQASRAIGVAAKAAKGTVGQAVTLTGYAAGAAAFGEDVQPGMSTILRLLFANGASTVTAVAGVIASGRDPAVPLNGAEVKGLGGLQADYSDGDIDLLVRGGVTPLENSGGIISPVRGITTRTKTGGAADATWRELTTILIVDDIIPAVRAALRSKFARAKNTARCRGAIRSQVIVELEKKVAAEIIDHYGEVTVKASADDPTVCLVEFGFAVAHGLNQIYLTVHITV